MAHSLCSWFVEGSDIAHRRCGIPLAERCDEGPTNQMVRIETKSGDALPAFLPELARLRIDVFRDFPYLYDGVIEHEENISAISSKHRIMLLFAPSTAIALLAPRPPRRSHRSSNCTRCSQCPSVKRA